MSRALIPFVALIIAYNFISPTGAFILALFLMMVLRFLVAEARAGGAAIREHINPAEMHILRVRLEQSETLKGALAAAFIRNMVQDEKRRG